jgi:hypothetical protein
MTVLYMLMTSLFLPIIICSYFALTHYEYAKTNPYEEASKIKDPRIRSLTNAPMFLP